MRFKAKRLFTDPILFYIILINFLRPECFTHEGLPSFTLSFFSIWDRLFCVLIIFLCFLAPHKARMNQVTDVLVFYIYKAVATVLVTYTVSHAFTGGGIFTHLYRLAAIWYISICLYYNYNETVRRLAGLLTILIVINCFTVIMFPGGMYETEVTQNTKVTQNFFLGYDNGHIVVFFPALYFSLRDAHIRKRKSIFLVCFSSVMISALICRSGTILAGLAVLIFLLVIIHFPGVKRFLFNWKTVFAGILLVFFIIVIFRRQDIFQDLIVNLFKKDLTLTHRTVLWDQAFKIIEQNPWFGIGDSGETNLTLFTLWGQKIAYSHNEILDIIVRSGIFGLLLYINCILRTRVTSKGKKSLESKVWLAFMSSYWLTMLFESYSNYRLYYLYFVLLLVPRFDSFRKNDSK